MEKINCFEDELNYISDLRIRESLSKYIETLPDYFFLIAASSSGKYHPSYALGEGGLVRHTKAVLKIADALFRNNSIQFFSSLEHDLIFYALLIHDSYKLGLNHAEHTRFDHPLIAAEQFMKNSVDLMESEKNMIKGMVESHMGQWNESMYESIKLPKPTNELSRFVHLCDYLASQKFLEIKF